MILNIYSHYTKPEGSLKFTDLIALAREKKINTLALTDHGNFTGIIEFYNICILNGIKPIIGLDFFYKLSDDSFVRLIIYLRNFEGYGQILKIIPHLQISSDGYFYLTSGFNFSSDNLICMVSLYKMDNYSESIDFSLNPNHILQEIENLGNFHSVFFQLINDEIAENIITANLLIDCAKCDSRIRLVAVNPVYYLHKQDYKIKEFLLTHYKSRTTKNIYTDQYADSYLQFESKFPPETIKNRQNIADQCNLLLDQVPFFFPKINLQIADSDLALDELKKIVNRNLNYFYSDDHDLVDLQEKIDFEFSIIKRDKLAVYFYFLYSFKEKFTSKYAGRLYFGGRVAYFFIAYLLRLTIVSPLSFKTNYSKALFNNPEKAPVIIINVASGQKNNLRSLLDEIFGSEKLCNLVDLVQWNASSLISALGKYLGHSKETIETILKSIPARYRFEPIKNLLRIDSLRNLLSENYASKELFRFAWLLDETIRVVIPDSHSLVVGHHQIEDILPIQEDNSTGKVVRKSFYDLESARFFGVWSVQINSHKALDILDQVVPKDKFLTEKDISLLTADLVKAIKNKDLDFLPYFSNREDKIKIFGLFGNHNLYNLAIYLESYLFSLDQLEEKVQTSVENSLHNDLKYTGGKIVFFEQLVFIIEKLFKDKGYSKSKKLIYNSKNIHYFKKMLTNLVKNKQDQQHIRWLAEVCLPSVFLTNLIDTAFKIFLALKMLAARKENYTGFLIRSFIEAINNDTADYEKFLQPVKKSNIKVLPIRLENTVLKAEYDEKSAELSLPIYVIRGIARHLSDYLYNFYTKIGSFTSLNQFLELVDKNHLHQIHCELLAKTGFFDSLNNNRKMCEQIIQSYYEIASQFNQDQQELFSLDSFIKEPEIIDDYNQSEKQELEEKITGFVFTNTKRLDISDFIEHLLIPDFVGIVYYHKIVKPNISALFSDYQDRKHEYFIPSNFIIDYYYPYFVKLANDNKTIQQFEIIKNPWQELNFQLYFSASSKQVELLDKLLSYENPSGNCSFTCYFTDLNREISSLVKISLTKTRVKEFIKLIKDNPYYLKII